MNVGKSVIEVSKTGIIGKDLSNAQISWLFDKHLYTGPEDREQFMRAMNLKGEDRGDKAIARTTLRNVLKSLYEVKSREAELYRYSNEAKNNVDTTSLEDILREIMSLCPNTPSLGKVRMSKFLELFEQEANARGLSVEFKPSLNELLNSKEAVMHSRTFKKLTVA